jgi:hypothetical protein
LEKQNDYSRFETPPAVADISCLPECNRELTGRNSPTRRRGSSEQDTEAFASTETSVNFNKNTRRRLVIGASFAVMIWQLLRQLCEAGFILESVAGNAHTQLYIYNFIT